VPVTFLAGAVNRRLQAKTHLNFVFDRATKQAGEKTFLAGAERGQHLRGIDFSLSGFRRATTVKISDIALAGNNPHELKPMPHKPANSA
jgi:hypothetical protein